MVSPPNGGAASSSGAASGVAQSTSLPRAAAASDKTHSASLVRPKSTAPSAPVMLSQPISARRSEKLDLHTVERRHKPLGGWRESNARTHHGHIQEAPTYRPSEEEWKDPMAYIRKISDVGRQYGIIKIIPPDNWDPDFVVDTERFHFKTRKQELNSVEGGKHALPRLKALIKTSGPLKLTQTIIGTRANLNYLDQLAKFHKQFGTNLARFPSVDKRPLDLYELKKAVEARGGFDKVCDRKKWAEIGRALGYSGKIMSSLSTSLKHSYERWLHPYEQYLRGAKPGVQMQLEQERGGPYGTPSPASSPFSPVKKSNPATPSSLSKESPAIKASQALNASINGQSNSAQSPLATQTQESAPPARSFGFTPINSSGFTAVNDRQASTSFTAANSANGLSQPQPQPSNSSQPPEARVEMNGMKPQQSFTSVKSETPSSHPSDLKRRLSETNDDAKMRERSSIDRQAKRPKTGDAPTVTGSHMMQHRMGNQARHNVSREQKSEKRIEKCQTCNQDQDRSNVVVCDGCYCSFHTYCLTPAQPEALSHADNWHCPKCLVGTGEFGFEDGGVYSLKQFQTKANDFKGNYFKHRMPFDPILNTEKPVTEDVVESEFWRLVQSLTETVEVEYGADIHSTTHGSAFPTIERHPRSSYSVDPWNLNNLPLHPDSLFRHIKSDISGMTVPWLYVGMCFSTFCWHNEDHYTYSANYQHFGDTKTWYGIPGEDAEKFEDAMRKAVPDLFEQQPDLLFQLVTLLPPSELRKVGVRVYAMDQRAGQFVITFPQAYHAGFNHGFNFNEAVNFAPADWEPFGRAGVERLREFRKPPCFSHDELLIAASSATGKDLSIKTAKWLAPALHDITEREKARRQTFEDHVEGSYYVPFPGSATRLQFERQTDDEEIPEEEYICSYCKAYSFLSRFTHPKAKKVSCLDHIDFVDWNGVETEFVLHLRIPTSRLEQFVHRTTEKAGLPDAWVEKFYNATADTARPQLKVLRSLLGEGERIPWELPQLPDLKQFVERCNEWVDEAISFISRKQQNRRKNEKAWRKGSQAKIAEIEEKEKDSRKLSKIRKLLAEAEQIGFDCQEIATLQEKLDQIVGFQHDAQDMIDNLATRQPAVAEVEEMIERGKAFFVDIPQVDHLEKILQQMKWCEKATLKGSGRTLNDVEELIREAPTLNVPPHNQQLQYLQDQKKRGEMWEVKAKELLNVEMINYSQLESFSKQAADLPVSTETLALIDSTLKKQREAQEMIYSMCRKARSAQLHQRPTYKEICDILQSIDEGHIKPHGTTDLEKLQRKHEDWMRRGKKLFGKTNAPLHILLQHLEIVESRNRYCFDISELPKNPVEPSSREPTPDEDQMEGQESNRDVFCLCRKPEDGMMIECKICHEWYHSKCLKIARGKIKEDDDFVCPICDHRVKIPRDAVRPKLEEMESWQAEIPNLPFQPEEEECLGRLITTAQNFRDFIQPLTTNPMVTTMEEVPTLRFYLRKIEGADILLAHETNFFRQEVYKFNPIAPEPPPIIEYSASTRKPRPTKQQKLMKEHGVERPEDLPQHLRTKQYHYKKRGVNTDRDRSGREGSGSSHHNTPQLQFRPPLTATEFPRKGRHQRPESPLFANIPDDAFATPASESATAPALESPSTLNTSGTPPSNLDPGLFSESGLGSLQQNDVPRSPSVVAFDNELQHAQQDEEEGDSGAGLFEGQVGSSQQSQGFDTMFADLTNQDDEKDTSGVSAEHEAETSGAAVDAVSVEQPPSGSRSPVNDSEPVTIASSTTAEQPAESKDVSPGSETQPKPAVDDNERSTANTKDES